MCTREQDSKALIFTQFTKVIDLLQDLCHLRGYNFARLDGGSTLDVRQAEIDRFNTDPNTCVSGLGARGGRGEAGGGGSGGCMPPMVSRVCVDWSRAGKLTGLRSPDHPMVISPNHSRTTTHRHSRPTIVHAPSPQSRTVSITQSYHHNQPIQPLNHLQSPTITHNHPQTPTNAHNHTVGRLSRSGGCSSCQRVPAVSA